MTLIRVLLADDHAPTRGDIKRAIEADPEMTVVAEADDAPTAVESAIAEQPDICMLDVRMPGSGIAAVWEIAARCPGTRIIMLSISSDDADLFGALRAGADGYLLKDMETTRIPFAIRDVLAGKAALPRSLTARVLEEFRDTAPRWRSVDLGNGAERLTSREWEVVALLRRGMTTRQIAKRLVLTPATVRTHVAAAVRKLGVPDRDSLLQELDQN